MTPQDPIPPSVRRILQVVGDAYDVTVSEIRGKSQRGYLLHARHLACYLLVRRAGYSLPNAGRMMGGRHHTTVLHSVRIVDKALLNVPIWVEVIDKIQLTAQLKPLSHYETNWQPPSPKVARPPEIDTEVYM